VFSFRGPLYLAVGEHVAASTQNHALSGLLFLLIAAGTFGRAFKLFLSAGKSPETFATFILLLAVLSVGLVSEEMIIASPAALAFWLLVSMIQKQRIQE